MKTSLRIIFVLALIFLLSVSLISCNGSGGSSDSSGVSEGSGEESTYYADADGDGYGDPDDSTEEESQPEGYVTDNTDCDDTDASINPDAQEIADDGTDNDCDGLFARTFYKDTDGDGTGDPDVSIVDTSYPEGYVLNDADCDDSDPDIAPGAPEICGDGIDNNCDGQVDELCTIRVPEDYSYIQYAIDVVSYGGTVLVNDGTYNENINVFGNAITIQSVNGAESTIIDGNEKGTVVILGAGDEGEGSVLDGFTITGGHAEIGGGIYCGESATITNCIITGNTATGDHSRYGGGGICGSPTITNCTISGNTGFAGGGIYGSPNITNSTISDNTAFGGIGRGNGGGISTGRHPGPASITDCTITNNTAAACGGGIYLSSASHKITNSTISGNTAAAGGGIKCEYGALYGALTTITNCNITNNTANSGGGMSVYRAYMTIINSTISGNRALAPWYYGGGGISIFSSTTLVVVNSIFWENIADTGKGNEIFVMHHATETSSADVTYSDIKGGWEGEGNIAADPLFVDDTSEDISLRDYHLQATSPCIDAGTSEGAPDFDFDGVERPIGEGYDMGSYEAGMEIYADDDGDGYTIHDGDCDDDDAAINPGVQEIYDGIDNNCDGQIDEGFATYYKDADGDGYGDPDDFVEAVSKPAGYVTDNTDCDDTDALVNPGAVEICEDGIDNNCSGIIDEGGIGITYYEDTDGDGFGDPDVAHVFCSDPGDGYSTDNTDCDDTDASIYPGAIELCRGNDSNCNGIIDEECIEALLVPADHDTIQEAIDAATDIKTILVKAGTYVENIDFKGKDVTVKSIEGAENTIIDGDAKGSVVTFKSEEGSDSVLDGFTITNGTGTTDTIYSDSLSGGGIYCDSSSPTITNCTISGNTADRNGGGIYCKDSSPMITYSTISGNETDFWGGGIWSISSSPTIDNCTITDNKATSQYGAGGGIGSYISSPTITNSTISGNSASGREGGGIYCAGSESALIENCIISQNSAGGKGGGIFCNNSPSDDYTIIKDCIIIDNTTADSGGGIYGGNYTSIINCTIADNKSTYSGGGISSSGSSSTITNCTITGNSAEYGGGIRCSRSSLITIFNTIVWGNTSYKDSNEIYLDDDPLATPDITYSNVKGGWEGEGNIDADPLFVGSGDFHIQAGSPCIDAGTSEGAPEDDIDGDLRDSYPDIGSDEYTE